MKILYAIQGTGNGHVSRANEIIPLLTKRCETDILISGNSSALDLSVAPTFNLHGLSFVNGAEGGINFAKTYKKANLRKFIHEINELPVENYDFVINDFEPVSAWACFKKKVPCIALSHQAALINKDIPRPSHKDAIGSFILKNYAPFSFSFGLHFSRYSKHVYTPVIRKEIREAERVNKGHYTVYLPAYNDQFLIDLLRKFPKTTWHVFSGEARDYTKTDNIEIRPVNSKTFTQSLISCEGILCGAGFETPAEALFLGKKLVVVPMRNQYEQFYNAAALRSIGVPVIRKLSRSKHEKLYEWIQADYKVEISYPNNIEKLINRIFEMYVEGEFNSREWPRKYKMIPGKKLL